jgi:hypothetical protein
MRSVVAVAKPSRTNAAQLPCHEPVRDHQCLWATVPARGEQFKGALSTRLETATTGVDVWHCLGLNGASLYFPGALKR